MDLLKPLWVQKALERTEVSDEARRVFHGRGGCHDGPSDLALEWYPPVLMALAYTEEGRNAFLSVEDAFLESGRIKCVVIQNRWLSGAPSWELRKGQAPDEIIAEEDGLKYRIKLMGRQNPGLFLASREVRRWVQNNSDGLRVLNLFSFTGSFGVCAKRGGAREVVNVDMKKGPLMEGRKNLELNGLPLSGVEFWGHDILRSKGKIKRKGPWDLVILDPPTLQKGAWVLKRDIHKLIRCLDEWVSSLGKVLLCVHDPLVEELQSKLPEWSRRNWRWNEIATSANRFQRTKAGA